MHVGSEILELTQNRVNSTILTGARLSRNRCQRLLTRGKLHERVVPSLDLGIGRNWVTGALGSPQLRARPTIAPLLPLARSFAKRR